MIDFRSDTVYKTIGSLCEFRFQAPVGDDFYGKDPIVIKFQEFAARMFSHEALKKYKSLNLSHFICEIWLYYAFIEK